MTRRLVVKILVHLGLSWLVALPVMLALVAAAILHHYYGWEGRGFLIVIAGIVGSISNGIGVYAVLEECSRDIDEWIDSIGREPRPMSYS